MHLDLNFICNSVGGIRKNADTNLTVTAVETDSRRIKPGMLFFALRGENFDGHSFLKEVFDRGASAAVVSKSYENKIDLTAGMPLIFADDTLQALQDLARAYRKRFAIPVVAVTGSVGKTTSKDLLAMCLQPRYKTLKTEGNYNNDIGLPLSVLRLQENHQAAVFELAMRAPGEIGRLARIAIPTCALITNAEAVHLETLGSVENVAMAKTEVMAGLGKDSFALLNGDNKELLDAARLYTCKKYSFGYNRNCDFQIKSVSVKNRGIEIDVRLLDQCEKIWLPLPSAKMASNVVSAAAVALLLGVDIDEIKDTLLGFKPGNNRLNIIYLPAGGIIINDTYNANPLSMAAALETGRELTGKNRLVAVLGDMFELGAYEVDGHLEVGQKAVESGVNVLVAIGERAKLIAQGAREAGMKDEYISSFSTKADGLEFLFHNIEQKDTILFKASRGMQLETMVTELISHLNGKL
ncbi:MAG: UDP-N-acetylmuramoyl-tripeptide--D-alanyl-D-alanine ligase [Syntrophomonas sp.]